MPVDISLPNGTVVSCLQKHEVPLVQLEIETYFSNGIQLNAGDTVFDVGANIGLFSVDAYRRCGSDLNVYAFEPVTPIYNVLRQNLERCAPKVRAKIFAFGLADISKSMPFAYYPRATVMSTAYPNDEDDLSLVKDAVLNSIMHLAQAPLAVRCLRWLPKRLSATILNYALKRTLQAEIVTCQLRTLSQVIKDHGLDQIDILKIDVEKAELDVLLGIDELDWPKIKQIVLDVHDDDGRLNTVIEILRKNGLAEITVEQPPTLKNSNIYTVFAIRKARTESGRTLTTSAEVSGECALAKIA